jgi:hypothetical protein
MGQPAATPTAIGASSIELIFPEVREGAGFIRRLSY